MEVFDVTPNLFSSLFFSEHFPYFKTAPSGWKNSVRHNLSLNKCFEKIENPVATGSQKKGCLWAMNPNKITKMDEEIAKWSKKDPIGIKKGMLMPGKLLLLIARNYSLNFFLISLTFYCLNFNHSNTNVLYKLKQSIVI